MYIMHTYFIDLLLKEAVLGRIKNYFKFLKHFLTVLLFRVLAVIDHGSYSQLNALHALFDCFTISLLQMFIFTVCIRYQTKTDFALLIFVELFSL